MCHPRVTYADPLTHFEKSSSWCRRSPQGVVLRASWVSGPQGVAPRASWVSGPQKVPTSHSYLHQTLVPVFYTPVLCFSRRLVSLSLHTFFLRLQLRHLMPSMTVGPPVFPVRDTEGRTLFASRHTQDLPVPSNHSRKRVPRRGQGHLRLPDPDEGGREPNIYPLKPLSSSRR